MQTVNCELIDTGGVDIEDLAPEDLLAASDVADACQQLFEIVAAATALEAFIVQGKAFDEAFTQTVGGPDAKLGAADRAVYRVASTLGRLTQSPVAAGLLFLCVEGIENLDSGSLEMLDVSRGNGEIMSACNRGDVAVLHRHGFPGELVLLLAPHVRYGDVETQNSSVHAVSQLRQPFLQGRTPLATLQPHPKGELRDNDGAGVAVVLMLLQPGNDSRVTFLLGRLT